MRTSPIVPLKVGNNGSYAAVRTSPAQGSCGTKSYPCKHPGLDVVGVTGTPVRAPENGVIALAADGTSAPFVGYGPWLVLMKGASGKYHLLAHLDQSTRSKAPIGLAVTAGQVIGSTSTANHTHWEVRSKMVPDFAHGEDNFSNNVDPQAWLGGGDFLMPVLLVGGAVLLYMWSSR